MPGRSRRWGWGWPPAPSRSSWHSSGGWRWPGSRGRGMSWRLDSAWARQHYVQTHICTQQGFGNYSTTHTRVTYCTIHQIFFSSPHKLGPKDIFALLEMMLATQWTQKNVKLLFLSLIARISHSVLHILYLLNHLYFPYYLPSSPFQFTPFGYIFLPEVAAPYFSPSSACPCFSFYVLPFPVYFSTPYLKGQSSEILIPFFDTYG